MDYGGYPQPGFAPPPSTFGYTMGAASGYSPYQQQYTQAGGASLGLSGLNFATSTLPGIVGLGAAGAAFAGDMLEAGGRTAGTRALGSALGLLDPFALPFRMGSMGLSAGSAVGRGLGFGMTLGRGSTAFLGASSMLGAGAGALAGATLAALPMYAAYKGGQAALSNMYQGGLNYVQGQNFASQFAPSVAPGQSVQNYSFDLQGLSNSTNMGMGDISRIARELDAQKLFQTTKDMKEFKDKLGTALKAVKEIASVTKTSIDDAVKMFGDLRAQGFYNTADIQAQAAVTQSRASITGLGLGTTLAVGGVGTQMARSMGLRGRVGSDLAQRNVTGVSLALRSGALSEEQVMEMGGVEEVGLAQANAQMRFLSTARGRTMIAGMMGAGGKMDPNRIRSVLSGNMTLEDLVTQTAEGGNLRAAGTREAREAAAPYAGMAMVQMAMMQQRQIYGGVSAEGTTRMLGTMGLSREESQALIKTLAQLPEQMRKERVEQENQDNRRKAEQLSKENSLSYQINQYTRPATDYFRGIGAGVVGSTQMTYANMMQGLFGGRTFGFDQNMLEAGMANRSLSLQQPLGAETGTLFGLNPTERLRRSAGTAGKTAEQLGYTQQQIDEMVRTNQLVSLGGGGLVSSDRYATPQELRSVSAQRGMGANAIRFSDQAQSKLIQLSMDQNARSLLTQDRGYMYKFREGVSVFSGGFIDLGFEDARRSKELQTSYAAAKRIGLIDSSVSIEEWERDPNRVAAETRMGLDLGATGAAVGLNLGGSGGLGAVSLGNIQQNTQKAIERGLNVAGGKSRALGEGIPRAVDELGKAVLSGPLMLAVPGLALRGVASLLQFGRDTTAGLMGISGAGINTSALGSVLAEGKNESRSLYMKFLKLISKKDLSKNEATELRITKEKLIEAVGGTDSPAAQEIEAQYSKSRQEDKAGEKYRRELTAGFARGEDGTPIGSLAMTEDQFQSDAVMTNIQSLIRQDEKALDLIKDEGVRGKVLDLITKSGEATTVKEYLDTRAVGLGAVLEKMAEGGVSAQEMEQYSSLTAGGGGKEFARLFGDILSGRTGKRELKETFKGISEEDLQKLSSKDPKKILEVLTKKTSMGESFNEDMGAGSEVVEGTELEFKKANTQFVQEVKSFVTMMKNSGVVPSENGVSAGVNLFGYNISVGAGTAPSGEK